MLPRYCFILFASFLTLFWEEVNAQNLVRNPSFETFANCPKKLGTMHDDVLDWITPTDGSTDYFNACSELMGTPKNFNGEQPADFGAGYVGFYFYAPDDYREYIQASLNTTLVKDEVYKVSFYVSLAERSDFAIKRLGVQFMENPARVATKKHLSRKHLSRVAGDKSNYFEIKYDDFYSDKEDWVLVEKKFTAKGTENFMIIGNFNDNQSTQKLRIKRNVTKGSYYYVDMVSVAAVNPIKNPNADLKNELGFELDSIHTFKNVLFGFDAFELLPKSKHELDEIVVYLTERKNLRIEIKGHTDAIGSVGYNKLLSKNRAQAVAGYLIEKGIDRGRVSYQGYGSERPVMKNGTRSGRQKNRRVEFRITE